MKVNNSNFKSAVGASAIALLVVMNLVIVGLFVLSYFLYIKTFTNGTGVFLLIVEAAFLLPLIFNTKYSLQEDHLFIFQWPFIRKKIRYCDIFEITDSPEDAKKAQKASISKQNKIYIGYFFYKEDKKTKEKEKIKKYIELSPKDRDLFLIKMGGKFKRARDLAAKLEEEHKKQHAEHYRKKAEADKKREEIETANKPVDVVIEPKKKTDAKSEASDE